MTEKTESYQEKVIRALEMGFPEVPMQPSDEAIQTALEMGFPEVPALNK